MRLHELQKMKKDVLEQLANSLDSFIDLFSKIKKDLTCGDKEREQAAVVITTLVMGLMENMTNQIASIKVPESNEVH